MIWVLALWINLINALCALWFYRHGPRDLDRFDDDRYHGDVDFAGRSGQQFDERGPRSGFGPRDYEPPPPARGGYAAGDDDYDFMRGRAGYGYGFDGPGHGPPGHPPPPRGGYYDMPPPPPPHHHYPSRRDYGPGDSFDAPRHDAPRFTGPYDPYADHDLLPPPPPPRAPPPRGQDAAAEGKAAGKVEEEDDIDPEREAFEAELARVAAEMEKSKQEEAAAKEAPAPVPPPPPPPPPPPRSDERAAPPAPPTAAAAERGQGPDEEAAGKPPPTAAEAEAEAAKARDVSVAASYLLVHLVKWLAVSLVCVWLSSRLSDNIEVYASN